MSKLFILGAGFSKAFSPVMPTLWELGQHAVDWENLPVAIPENSLLRDDVEQLLTYFHSEMPWKTAEEFHLGKAAFFSVTQQLASYISDKEGQAFEQETPQWLKDFIRYLHKQRHTVATLNYDTIVERAFGYMGGNTRAEFNFEEHLYQLPIASLGARTVAVLAGTLLHTFRLLKLHGSIHWYSSGEENVVGQQVYYDPLAYRIFEEDHWIPNINKKDLTPLIIPPVAEKSAFYRTRLIRTLWTDFREAISAASEIYCVGYSLPKTDLTMNLFLSSTASSDKTVFLVNNASGKNAEILITNYQQVFGSCTIDQRFLGLPNSVEAMVNHLVEEQTRE